MERSTVLSRIADKGFARVCPPGCIHVSYGPITLDFAREGFETFARMIRRFRGQNLGRVVEVQYDRATLRFAAEEFGEFVSLVLEAHARLACLDRPAPQGPEVPPLRTH
jgi:hypothetical protein